jgi:ADP-heptose:LPS heptosyltransferase
MTEARFLIVRLGSLGDILHAFPAVSGLRDSFPNAEIVWLTHPKWEFLVKTCACTSYVWTVDTRDWANLRSILQRIRRHQFHTAIDFQGLWKSAAIPFLARVPQRIGFSATTVREWGVPLLYTDRVNANSAQHIADQNGELPLRSGAKRPTGSVKLTLNPEDERIVAARLLQEGIDNYVVLNPGGGWRSKCWPADRYGLLAKKLATDFSIRSVINVGPGEDDLATAISQSAGDARPLHFSGNLGQLMALLNGASAVVAGDTGPLHLADTLGTKIVAIFGPTDPARNGPYHRSGTVLRWEGAVTTYKRGAEPDESLLHISVDEVLQALHGIREAA